MGAAEKALVDSLGRSNKKSRAAKGISTEEVVSLWNRGPYWTMTRIAKKMGVSGETVSYHIQKAEEAGTPVRRVKHRVNKKLSEVLSRHAYLFNSDAHKAEKLSLLQRVLLGLTLRQPGKRFSLTEILPFYWQTVRSLIARGLARIVQEKGQSWFTTTDPGQVASHQHLPVEVMLREE